MHQLQQAQVICNKSGLYKIKPWNIVEYTITSILQWPKTINTDYVYYGWGVMTRIHDGPHWHLAESSCATKERPTLTLETKFLHCQVSSNPSYYGKNLLLMFLHLKETSNWDTSLYLKVGPEVPEWMGRPPSIESGSVYKSISLGRDKQFFILHQHMCVIFKFLLFT